MRFIHLLLVNICVAFQANVGVISDSPLLFDSFGQISCEEEIARLDNYALKLTETANATGVIIVYGGRRDTRRGEIAARLLAVRKYLASKTDKNRLLILNGGYREKLTIELWLIPYREHASLLINTTVEAKDVKFKKGSIKMLEYKCRRSYP